MKVKTGYVVRSFKLKTFNGCPYMDLDVGDLIVLSDATDDISGSPAKAQMRCAAKPHPVRSVCTPRLASRPAQAIRPRGVHEIGLLCVLFVHLEPPSESLSYTYSGPKRGAWTYDAHANVTADPQGGMSIAWNALDLPRTLTAGSAPCAPYLDFGARLYSPRYERVRLNYMDDYGYKTSSGDQVLAAARTSEPRSYRQWLSGSAGSNAITTVTGAVGELASGVGQQFYNERQGTL